MSSSLDITKGGAPDSYSNIVKQTRELLNPEPTELQLKIDTIKCQKDFEPCNNFGKWNQNFNKYCLTEN